MTAASADIKTDKLGTEDTPPPQLLGLPVAANVQIFAGTFAASDTNGRAVPCTSASALMLWGRVERQVNNLTSNSPFGAAGAQNVTIRPGPYYFSSDGSVTAGMVGQPVFALDDNTVTTNPTKAGTTYWLPFAGVVMPPGVGDFGFSPTDATKIPVWVGAPAPTSMVLHANIPVSLATIQAGASGTAFNIGPVLPGNARVLATGINVATPLSGGGATAVTASLATSADAAFPTNPKGTLIAATTVFTGAFTPIAVPGSNPYQSRGGQQLQMTITVTTGTQPGLTAGVLSVDVFYTIEQ